LLRGKTTYVKYIPRMSKRAAEGMAAAYALGHAAELASLKAMPGPVAETVIAGGGWESLRHVLIPTLEELVGFAQKRREFIGAIEPRKHDAASIGWTVEKLAMFKFENLGETEQETTERKSLETARAIVRDAVSSAPSPTS
jgi:hypothetical protein